MRQSEKILHNSEIAGLERLLALPRARHDVYVLQIL
jgi:hypothetical protein